MLRISNFSLCETEIGDLRLLPTLFLHLVHHVTDPFTNLFTHIIHPWTMSHTLQKGIQGDVADFRYREDMSKAVPIHSRRNKYSVFVVKISLFPTYLPNSLEQVLTCPLLDLSKVFFKGKVKCCKPQNAYFLRGR